MVSGRPITIAIDGPAGAGKSTVSKAVARRLGYTYVDTGAMYRAVALLGIRKGLLLSDPDAFVAEAARAEMTFYTTADGPRFMVNGEDLTEAVRAPEVGAMSSPVSAIPGVRKHLTAMQRRMAKGGGVVMEGRDIGTVVCPQAEVKIFLTATPQERARRRYEEERAKGEVVNFEQVLSAIRERDERDTGRKVAPLKRAPDAIEVVTDGLSVEEVVERILELVKQAQAS